MELDRKYEKLLKKGVYRHFKGDYYELLCVAYNSEDSSPMVVYRALYGEGMTWVRDAAMWCERVTGSSGEVARFEFVGNSVQEIPD